MTDITELAQREKFEAWFVNDVAGADVNFPAFKDGEYTEGEIYDEQLYFMLQAMWMAWKAAGAEMVEALEKAQAAERRWHRVASRVHEQACESDVKIDELEAIRAAAEKLVRCKGRYHSEQNYRALAALFGVNIPDLPPLEHENVHYADAAEMEIEALRQRIAELESRTVKLPDGWQFEECEIEGCENGAIFSVGTGSRNIHLCDKCAHEPQNSRLKKSPLSKRLPFKMSAGIKVEAE
ncbi:ead/Ea22-like family protein [Klebsiella pneumoniae]